MAICLRRAKSFMRQSDSVDDEDFDVFVDDKRIGRLYLQPSSSLPWRWCLSSAIAVDTRGRADTQQEAAEALATAYRMLRFSAEDVPPVEAWRLLHERQSFR